MRLSFNKTRRITSGVVSAAKRILYIAQFYQAMKMQLRRPARDESDHSTTEIIGIPPFVSISS